MSGVLNLVIAGVESLLANGNFVIPDAVHQAVDEFILESDSVYRFLQEGRYSPDPNNRILLQKIYEAYRDFCDNDGCKSVEKIAFAARARGLNFVVKKSGHEHKMFVYASQQV
jgi:phage/plasmid-associated DNA primase